MKQESINKLQSLMIETFKKKGDENVLIIRSNPTRIYTGNEMAKEIEDETEFGVHTVDNMIQLTIDLLSRDKINIDKK